MKTKAAGMRRNRKSQLSLAIYTCSPADSEPRRFPISIWFLPIWFDFLLFKSSFLELYWFAETMKGKLDGFKTLKGFSFLIYVFTWLGRWVQFTQTWLTCASYSWNYLILQRYIRELHIHQKTKIISRYFI